MTTLLRMDQIHVVRVDRGLTSATASCTECGYTFVTVNDCHGGVSIDSGRLVDRGNEGAVHVLPGQTPLPQSA